MKTLIVGFTLSLLLSSHAVFAAEESATPQTAESAAQQEKERTVTLSIPGMNCSMCPITIRKALKKVEGVIEADADHESKTAVVKFDPARTTTDALIKATTDAGYPSSLVEEEQAETEKKS